MESDQCPSGLWAQCASSGPRSLFACLAAWRISKLVVRYDCLRSCESLTLEIEGVVINVTLI